MVMELGAMGDVARPPRGSKRTWVVKALVEATEDSRPAFRYTPSLVVRAMSEPT